MQKATATARVRYDRPGTPGKDATAWALTATPGSLTLAHGQATSVTFTFSITLTRGSESVRVGVASLGQYGVRLRYDIGSATGFVSGYDTLQAGIAADTESALFRLVGDGGKTVLAQCAVPVARNGQAGAKGLAGPVIRVTEWAEGFAYQDGSSGDPAYLDIATIGGDRWMCKSSHLSSQANKPSTDTDRCPDCWQPMDSTSPLYTPLLLAPNARIDFLNGQELVLFDSKGNGVGRFGYPIGRDNGPVLTAGDTDPDAATFLVNADGKVRMGALGDPTVWFDPDDSRMVFRDDSGKEYASFEGNALTGAVDANAALARLCAWEPEAMPLDAGAVAGQHSDDKTVALGRFSVSRDNTALTGAWRGLAEMTTQGRNAAAGYEIAAVRQSDGTRTILGSSKATSSTGTASKSQVSAAIGATLPKGDYSLELRMSITGSSTSTLNPDGSLAGVTYYAGRVAVRLDTLSLRETEPEENYRARYFANGLYLGQSASDHLMAWRDGESGMAVEAMNRNGHGLRLCASGLMVCDPEVESGGWMTLRDYIKSIK